LLGPVIEFGSCLMHSTEFDAFIVISIRVGVSSFSPFLAALPLPHRGPPPLGYFAETFRDATFRGSR
jgi:hypothetical protein